MTRQLINTGILPNDGQGDSLRDAGGKINSNFSELYTALGNGTALTVINNNLITATGANKISFLYNTLAELPSASTYHGIFADVDVASTTPQNGQALIYDAGAQKWKPGDVAAGGGAPGDDAGATTFTGLTDTPADYGGLNGGFLRVNGAADGLEIVAGFSI